MTMDEYLRSTLLWRWERGTLPRVIMLGGEARPSNEWTHGFNSYEISRIMRGDPPEWYQHSYREATKEETIDYWFNHQKTTTEKIPEQEG